MHIDVHILILIYNFAEKFIYNECAQNFKYQYAHYVTLNMAETSQITRASSISDSLRATIPKGIVSFLRIEVGETLVWEMEIIKGERVVVVKPAQKRLA